MLRIRWTAAGGPVTGYKVQYVPLTGLGQQITAERQEVNISIHVKLSGPLSDLKETRENIIEIHLILVEIIYIFIRM